MQIFILIALCGECILLASLAYFKNLTKKAFVCISLVTFVCCAIATVLSGSGYSAAKKENQEENIYIAARLVQEKKADSAKNLLGKAIDSEYEKYGIQNLRGLIFELTGAYDTTLIYLEDVENETARMICEAAIKKKPAEDSLTQTVTTQTIEALKLKEKDIEKLEAQIQLQYFSIYEEQEEEAEQISEKERREQRFEELAKGAKNGNLEDVIAVSNLYIQNYTLHTLEEQDEEYDNLLKEATAVQIRLNQAAVTLSHSNTESQENNENGTVSEEQKEYNYILAEYNIILDEMSQERVKRAINYLEANKPRNHQNNIAYQMQMAILYYQAADKENAAKALDYIFNREEIDKEQWLGLDCYLLRESYLEMIGNGNSDEFEMLFYQTMNNLGQGSQSSFFVFFQEYLEGLFRGLAIGKIDISAYPNITAEVSVSKEELVLSKQNIIVTDTEEVIKNVEIREKESSEMAICFVLDRSGSMAGNNLKDSKKAIRENVITLGENVKVALVSFESDSRVECGLTDSKYAVSAAVDKIQDEGGTNIAAGLQDANEILAATAGERVVILLSDGHDGNKENIKEVLAYSKANGIRVYTIGLQGCDEDYLTQIAKSTGGTFIPANKTNKLTQIYEEINNYISHTYYVTYEVVNTEVEVRELYIRLKDSLIQTKKDYSLKEEVQESTKEKIKVQKSDFYKQTGDAIGGGTNE